MGKPRRNSVTDQQIIDAYAEHASIYIVARELGVGTSTIQRVLLTHGVERNGLKAYRTSITKFLGQEQEIKAAYDAGATMKELAEKFGEATHYAFKSAIKRAGGELRPNPVSRSTPAEVDLIRELNRLGVGQMAISVAIGRSQSFVSRVMLNNGIRPQPNAPRVGYTDPSGYSVVPIEPDDPLFAMARFTGYVLEHRIVVARRLGRVLSATETVHHIDGDRLNNADSNLQLRQGKHGKGTVMQCLDCGSHNIGSVPIAAS